MKKLLLSIAMILSFVVSASADVTRSIGVTGFFSTIDSSGHEDVDNNGTKDTTKSFSNDIVYGSVFAEASRSLGNGAVITAGIDLIPMTAEFDSRSTSQSSMKDSSTATEGTNRGTVEVDQHVTLYIQPGFDAGNGITVFGTLGYVTADVDSKIESVSSTNKTVSESLDGTKMGIGVKGEFGDDMFFKLEYAETDYDTISVTTTNNTKVTADIDNKSLGLSIGKSF